MSDILSAMREFRALDDKRRAAGLGAEDEARWNDLRAALKGGGPVATREPAAVAPAAEMAPPVPEPAPAVEGEGEPPQEVASPAPAPSLDVLVAGPLGAAPEPTHAGAQVPAAEEAAAGGYVLDEGSGLYWHGGAGHWYDPASGRYCDPGGGEIPPEVAQAQVAAHAAAGGEEAFPADLLVAGDVPLDEPAEAPIDLPFALDGAPDDPVELASGADFLPEAAAAQEAPEAPVLLEEVPLELASAARLEAAFDAPTQRDVPAAPASPFRDGAPLELEAGDLAREDAPLELASGADFLHLAAAAQAAPALLDEPQLELAPGADAPALLEDGPLELASGADFLDLAAAAQGAPAFLDEAPLELASGVEPVPEAADVAPLELAADAAFLSPSVAEAADETPLELASGLELVPEAADVASLELAADAAFLSPPVAEAADETPLELDAGGELVLLDEEPLELELGSDADPALDGSPVELDGVELLAVDESEAPVGAAAAPALASDDGRENRWGFAPEVTPGPAAPPLDLWAQAASAPDVPPAEPTGRILQREFLPFEVSRGPVVARSPVAHEIEAGFAAWADARETAAAQEPTAPAGGPQLPWEPTDAPLPPEEGLLSVAPADGFLAAPDELETDAEVEVDGFGDDAPALDRQFLAHDVSELVEADEWVEEEAILLEESETVPAAAVTPSWTPSADLPLPPPPAPAATSTPPRPAVGPQAPVPPPAPRPGPLQPAAAVEISLPLGRIVPVPAAPRAPEAPAILGSRVLAASRVVVHSRDGVVRRGQVSNVDLADESFVLAENGTPVPLATSTLKAVFVMRGPGEPAPSPQGRKVRITFVDGRPLQGWAVDAADPVGFFVVPADTRGNAARVFVYRAAVRELALD